MIAALPYLAAAFVVVWFLGKFFERAAAALVVAVMQFFQVDGRAFSGRVDSAVSPVPGDSQPTRAGSPFAVDASNGPSNVYPASEAERRDLLRLGGLVELHRMPDGMIPPPSRRPRIH